MRNQLSISLGQFSDAGAKPVNQDFYGALQPDGAELTSKGIALAIADGISTSNLGATAAETAVKSFLSDYFCTSEGWSVRTSGARVIGATNSWMHAQNRKAQGRTLSDTERERGLVCTFTAMVLKSRAAHLFHIGDGQIAKLGKSHIEPLTEPHRVSLGGGETYLGRALGVERNVEIDYRLIRLEPGDTFMLSTDGVYEHLSGSDILDHVAKSPCLNDAARAICVHAQEAGSTDNLTVQLVRVETLPAGEINDLIGTEGNLPPAPALRPGDEFSGYAILREIHSGSRSHVYLARDEVDGQRVAIKVLATEQAQDPAALSSLLLEEWVMRRLDHPHLLKPAPHRGPHQYAFTATQYIEGQTLYAWMHDHKSSEPELVRALIRQIASGVQALHRREMIHRDLRPQNILIDGDGTARLCDFGSVQVAGIDEVARPVDDAAFAGTMQYSAPELYLGFAATTQSDLYSLGVITYQLLTGELPYGPRVASANTRAAQRRLRYVPASELNPQVPEWMDAAIARAVEIEPSRRYDELSEFLFDLANPNPALHSPEPRTLLERGSVRVWRAISAVLTLALALSWFARPLG